MPLPQSLARVRAATAAGIAVACLAAVLAPAQAEARRGAHRASHPSHQRVTARWSGSVDVNSRARVNAAYWTRYATKMSVPVSWSGNVSGCRAGATSATSTLATQSSVNYVRSLAGLAPVSFTYAMNARSQATALMMAANNSVSHAPPRSWRCWSSAGAYNAPRSNLALARTGLTSGRVVDMYMDDPGSSNTAVGHRRWLLNPSTATMGSGSTPTTNSITVIGATNARRPNPAWVSWPSVGYFPNPIEPGGRWSLSSGLRSVSFARAKVRVYYGHRLLRTHRWRAVSGYAMPTVAWQMPAGFNKAAAYKVVVSNIRKAGSHKRFRHTYVVRLFTPTR